MRHTLLAVLIGLAFGLGTVVRGEADDAHARPTDAEVKTWVRAIETSKGPHKADLIRKLVSEADRAVPLMYEHIEQLSGLKQTLTIIEVQDIREATRERFAALEALITTSSIRWHGDGKLVVCATRDDVAEIAKALDHIRASEAERAAK